MFSTRTHIIINSDFKINHNIFTYYEKHDNPEIKTNIKIKIILDEQYFSISLNPTAARYIAKQLLNCADEMDNDV